MKSSGEIFLRYSSTTFVFSAPAGSSLLRMSTPYERVKGGKLTFKGGLGPEKAIKKSKKHKKKVAAEVEENGVSAAEKQENTNTNNTNPVSTIDPTSRKNYEELFPVEAKKFGYAEESNPKTAEEALNARVKKKADRYCK